MIVCGVNGFSADRDVGVTVGAEPVGQQRLAQRGGVGGQPPTDPVGVAQILLGLPGGQVHDVGAVEAAQVERLVEFGTQFVEERGDQRQVRIAVQIAGPDQQRPDADAVQRARVASRAHPALRDQGPQQRVRAAARHVRARR